MRHTTLLAGALALVCACRPRAERAASPITPLRPLIEPVSAPAAAPAVDGAAQSVTHPNEGFDDEVLGRRVNPRRVAIPAVGMGQSSTFRFDGDRRGWVLRLADGATLTTPAYAQGKVYVGAGFTSTTVYALDASTGALRWAGETPDGGPSAAIVEDDTVMFNTESCTIFAFDVRTGRLRWSKWLGDPLMSLPTAGEGRVFSAYPDGESPTGFSFAALATRNGRVLWRRSVPADVMTAAVLSGDSLYLTTMNGVVQRLRARDGRRIWSRALNATSAPSVDGERVYVAQRGGGGRERQLSLDLATGAVQTRGELVRAPWASQRPDTAGVEAGWAWEGARPVTMDGRIYHAMGDEIVARDAASGRTLWRRRTPLAGGRRAMTSPAVVGSQLVVATREGDLFGMDIDTGATTWAYRVGEPIAFQPAVANGWVYAATARGRVIGLEVGDRALDGWHMWGGDAKHVGLRPSEPAPATPDARPTRGVLQTAAGEAFPLTHTDIDAEVTGPVARVTVTQTFSNPHPRPVDATYLFPLPADGAVDTMDLAVGTRVIHARIARREEARRTFASARARGGTAALLEQDRPNLFRQSVANIAPGETVRVTLRFVETVPFRDGSYELAMPLATASRYTPGQGGVTPTRPAGDVGVRVAVAQGVSLAEVSSPSHAVTVTGARERGEAQVALAQGATIPDRDFVLRWRPRVDVVAPAVLARREGAEGFVSLVLHPDARAADDAITPREMVFMVDASSSMRGAAMDHAKSLLRRAIDTLRAGDTFRVLRFSDMVTPLDAAALPATEANRARARAWVDALAAAGTTEMLPAIEQGLSAPEDPTRVRMVVFVTDGYVGNERAVLGAVQQRLGAARVFPVGVGNAVNRYLLENIAEIGRGDLQVVTPREDPRAAAERVMSLMDRPYLTDVRVSFHGAVRDVYPRVVPDLFAGRPVVVHGRYDRGGPARVTVSGRVRGREWSRTLDVVLPQGDTATATDPMRRDALPSLWARARVKHLSRAMLLGEVPALRDEVTSLGLRFGLVTAYTSFVAVDESGGDVRARIARIPRTTAGVGASGMGYAGSVSLAQGIGSAVVMERSVRGAVAMPSPEPARPTLARIDVSESAGGGGASREDALRSAMRLASGRVRALYERALRANPALQGRIVLELTVGEGGRVTAATVVENTTGDAALAQQIAAMLRATVVVPPGEGTTTRVPFAFRAG